MGQGLALHAIYVVCTCGDRLLFQMSRRIADRGELEQDHRAGGTVESPPSQPRIMTEAFVTRSAIAMANTGNGPYNGKSWISEVFNYLDAHECGEFVPRPN